MTGVDVVTAARLWVGTPYVHQASARGFGADCLGLLLGVWRDLLACEPEPVPNYTADWSEADGTERLWSACARHLVAKRVEDDAVGDVILFRMRDGSVAKHLGVQVQVGQEATFIHAYSGHGVLESSLSTPWQRRIVARFAFPIDQTGDL
jgi:NlpC/P60 family putative phage cell wall peptidase